ncbi:MAG TPA: FeoC-like transcriptional regulator [Actinotalea sp.]
MTTLEAVAREAAGGATAGTIAARLGAPADLVEAMLAELVRSGVVADTPTCTSDPSSGAPCEVVTPACAGCPLAAGAPSAVTAGPRFLGWLGTRRRGEQAG